MRIIERHARRFRPSRFLAFLAACLASGAFVRAEAAECSLHSMSLASEIPEAPQAGVEMRRTAAAPFSGTALSEVEAQVRIPAGARWDFAVQWPLAFLDRPEGGRVGMGNPSGSVGFRYALSPAVLLLSGAQASVPLGDIGDGLAADHFMAGLHQGIAWVTGPWRWEAMGGADFMLPAMSAAGNGSHAGHAGSTEQGSASATYASLHPHGNREWMYRVASARKVGTAFSLALALNGRHILGTPMAPATGSDIVEMEAGMSVLAKGAVWRPFLQAPATEGGSAKWSAGLSVLVGL
jgi:hypothetical protein